MHAAIGHVRAGPACSTRGTACLLGLLGGLL